MNIMQQGGLLMWPLLALSVAALAVMLERFVVYTTRCFPGSGELQHVLDLFSTQGEDAALKDVAEKAPAFLDFFAACLTPRPLADRERVVQTAGDEVLFRFNARLDFLATAASTAPLIGLLGTVFGMINAFSRLASAGNVDITMLADGIWQALLTTAAGLTIAIPTLLAHRWFCRQYDDLAFAMQQAAERILETAPSRSDKQ